MLGSRAPHLTVRTDGTGTIQLCFERLHHARWRSKWTLSNVKDSFLYREENDPTNEKENLLCHLNVPSAIRWTVFPTMIAERTCGERLIIAKREEKTISQCSLALPDCWASWSNSVLTEKQPYQRTVHSHIHCCRCFLYNRFDFGLFFLLLIRFRHSWSHIDVSSHGIDRP